MKHKDGKKMEKKKAVKSSYEEPMRPKKPHASSEKGKMQDQKKKR